MPMNSPVPARALVFPHEKWISKAMSSPKMGWLWGEAARNMRCCRNALGSRGERLRLCWEVFARTVQAENVERLRWVRQAMRACQHHFASIGCLPLPSAPAASSLPLYILPQTRQEEPCPSLPPKTDDVHLGLTSPFLGKKLSSNLAYTFFFPVIFYNLGRVWLDGALSHLI